MPPFQLAALAVGLASGMGLYGIADDRGVSNAILALDHDGKIEVEWDEKTK